MRAMGEEVQILQHGRERVGGLQLEGSHPTGAGAHGGGDLHQ
jgi:hypothetical protein